MPELLEIETYRIAAEPVVGRRITSVHAPDDWYAKGDTTTDELRTVLPGHTVTGTRRIGKLLLLDTDGPTLGLRFGMTGRLLVDGGASIDQLEYSSDRNDPAWDRFGLAFGVGDLVMRDPRRLGGIELEPDESRLGPDATTVTVKPFREILRGSGAPVKARLMDQARLAGMGNLLTDDALWRGGIDPTRPANSLSDAEVARLHRAMRRTLEVLGGRGGSHTGDMQPARVRGGACPKCGEELRRDEVGGRTTYWCARHQS